MSYDISMHDDAGKRLTVEPFTDGGTYPIGGTVEADFNVTYNYYKHFRFGQLHGVLGKDAEPLLAEAVGRLGTQRDPDYWKPTAGNAGAACARLLMWARQHPHGSFHVS